MHPSKFHIKLKLPSHLVPFRRYHGLDTCGRCEKSNEPTNTTRNILAERAGEKPPPSSRDNIHTLTFYCRPPASREVESPTLKEGNTGDTTTTW